MFSEAVQRVVSNLTVKHGQKVEHEILMQILKGHSLRHMYYQTRTHYGDIDDPTLGSFYITTHIHTVLDPNDIPLAVITTNGRGE